MFGIDVASYQKSMDFRREEFDFAIVKATEGYDYTSPSFRYFVDELTKLDKLIGVYHFARPDRHSSVAHIKREADHFVKKVSEAGLIGKAILVLDWEKEPTSRSDLISAFMNRVISLTGVLPFLYASRSVLMDNDLESVTKLYPLWMAQWPFRQSMNPTEVDEFVHLYRPAQSPVDWKIWQFTDNGAWVGYHGTVDFNWTDMTAEDWKNYAASGKKEAPTVKTEPSTVNENLSDAMKWAVELGLFKGYGDGRYGPTDYLTRDQCARVLHRYTKVLEETIGKAIKNS